MSKVFVTHASPECPLLTIDLDWGTTYIEDVGLSVEVVKDNNPEELKKIKTMAMNICAGCIYHCSDTGEGVCNPGGHIWPSEADVAGSTILVNQRAEIPDWVKHNPKYDYIDF